MAENVALDESVDFILELSYFLILKYQEDLLRVKGERQEDKIERHCLSFLNFDGGVRDVESLIGTFLIVHLDFKLSILAEAIGNFDVEIVLFV